MVNNSYRVATTRVHNESEQPPPLPQAPLPPPLAAADISVMPADTEQKNPSRTAPAESATAMETPLDKCRRIFHIKNPLLVNCLSEFYATCLLLFIGIGIVCQFDLSGKALNTWVQINIGWGFAIAFCVYTISHTSGGHLNPAISLMFYSFGKIPLSWVFYYGIAQTTGAFVGTALAYSLYYDQVWHAVAQETFPFTANITTAAIFTSMPPMHVSNFIAFWDQFVGTGFLALFVAVIVDPRNEIPTGIHALLVGFVIAMIGMAFGMNVGYPINPARDFAPRVFAAMVGYGPEVFSYHNFYFWIPVIAPFFGAVFAAWSYYFFVGFHIPDKEDAKASYLKDGKDKGDAVPLTAKGDMS